MNDAIPKALRDAIRRSKSPGGVLYVGDPDRTYLHIAHGLRQRISQRKVARLDTLYDLASLTKVVATTTALMLLRDEGRFSLDQPITEFVPIPAFRDITLLHLLTHTAGLVPVEPYYETLSSVDEILQQSAKDGIIDLPDTVHSYSDVGFMLLGKLVEILARDSLDAFCNKRIFEPLGMHRTAFNPPAAWARNCAATEYDPWRERVIVGEVHDENAYAVGGVAGHAGLFSTAEDLALFCRALLTGQILPEGTLKEMTTLGIKPLYPWQGIGWEMDPWATKKKGYLPSRSVFGHTGWTGTSMWLDRDTGLFAILLGNTCHPSRAARDTETFRRIVHRGIARTFYPNTTNTHTGLDRLTRENFHIVEKKRIALLTNSAAVDQLGRPITDVLRLTDLPDLRIIYSPEHGFRGQAEAGANVGEQAGDRAGAVPVISLYGARKAPTPEELEAVDLFVIDLQDIGARYYTYMATMRRCLEACARAKTPALILDRPNPIGGVVLEGPIATDTSSDVSSAAIPVRHGMTMGELALFFLANDLKDSGLELTINTLDNWQPERLFGECSLPWIPPSPNIPTPETALLYIGTCLFEGTNLNEGRGTETPFSLIGAPWLAPQRIVDSVHYKDRAGCSLEAVDFTPRSIPGKASNPRYKNKICHGIRIHLEDPRVLRPFRLTLALLRAIRRHHPKDFQWTSGFDRLAGGSDLRARIEAGSSARAITRHHESALRAFDKTRPKLHTQVSTLTTTATIIGGGHATGPK